MHSLDGKQVVITGASAGIGRASAVACAAAGADVTIGARRLDRLETIAAELRDVHDVSVTPVQTDVTDSGDVERLMEVAAADGGVDVVVANAGLATEGTVEELSDESYRTMMATNTDGMFFTARSALPHLRARSGTIIFIASFTGVYPRSTNPVYAATKWWTRGFAQSLMAQVGDSGIGISVINPSEVRTEFGSQRGVASKERYAPGEVTEPEAIAEAVVFAAQRDQVDTAAEISLFRRDRLSML
jgi:NADP-dependent 3-hydroxy acid dehydrogenase YdfG